MTTIVKINVTSKTNQCQRDFIEIVRGGHDEALRVSLHELQEQFRCSWGMKCLNSLRALHDVCFSIHND